MYNAVIAIIAFRLTRRVIHGSDNSEKVRLTLKIIVTAFRAVTIIWKP